MSFRSNDVLPLSVRSLNDNIIENPKNGKVNSVSVDIDPGHAKKHTVMSFHDINYTVKLAKSPCGACRPKNEKQILTNVR